jgi:hypothetical protein
MMIAAQCFLTRKLFLLTLSLGLALPQVAFARPGMPQNHILKGHRRVAGWGQADSNGHSRFGRASKRDTRCEG